jgi:hypothetical protein
MVGVNVAVAVSAPADVLAKRDLGRNEAEEMNGDRSRPDCRPARPAPDPDASEHTRR